MNTSQKLIDVRNCRAFKRTPFETWPGCSCSRTSSHSARPCTRTRHNCTQKKPRPLTFCLSGSWTDITDTGPASLRTSLQGRKKRHEPLHRCRGVAVLACCHGHILGHPGDSAQQQQHGLACGAGTQARGSLAPSCVQRARWVSPQALHMNTHKGGGVWSPEFKRVAMLTRA